MRGPQAFPDRTLVSVFVHLLGLCSHARRPEPAALADMDRGRDSKRTPLQVPAVQMPAPLISL